MIQEKSQADIFRINNSLPHRKEIVVVVAEAEHGAAEMSTRCSETRMQA